MNKINYMLLLGVFAWLFAACEEEHPGYLFSNEADYPLDSLIIQKPALQQQILDAKIEVRDNFGQTEEGRVLYQQRDQLQNKFDELTVKIDELNSKSYELEDLLYYGPPLSPEESDRIWAEYDQVLADLQAAQSERGGINNSLKEVKEKIKTAVGNIDAEIVLLQRRLDNNVAYSSSPIDRLQGTAPIIYSIAAIKVQGTGDADKFADYVSVMGMGRFLVKWDEDIPVGRYVISLYVENEGWKDLLPDIFTIIVVDR